MTSKRSGSAHGTTPSSKCSATGPSAITSRGRRSSGPGSCSRKSGDWKRSVCGRRCSPATRSWAWRPTTRPKVCGRSARTCPPSASCAAGRRTTSGRWGRRDRAAPVRNCTTTSATIPQHRRGPRVSRASKRVPVDTWRSGTSSSFSSTANKEAGCSRCRPSTLTRAWGSSAFAAFSKARIATTRPMCSYPSSTASPSCRGGNTAAKPPWPCRSSPTM